VEVLLVGVGTLSGVQRLEVLCMFAVLSVLVNYVVFMTFYPACLSLIFDLSRSGVDMSVVREKAKGSLLLKSLTEEEQKANPVLQRVKLIMTTGLMAVHIYSRVAFSGCPPKFLCRENDRGMKPATFSQSLSHSLIIHGFTCNFIR